MKQSEGLQVESYKLLHLGLSRNIMEEAEEH
jgi:hypothetical protein